MQWIEPFAESIRVRGWAVTPPVISQVVLQSVIESLSGEGGSPLRGGMRNLLDLPAIVELARSAPVRSVAASVLGQGCFAVRGLLFDKQPEANWKVPWHQDLTIAVRQKRETFGFGPWSMKADIHHVQAPPELLENMLAVRIHLDECGSDNGPLRLISGSHRDGILRTDQIEIWIAGQESEMGLAEAGSILGFRPLLLHASSCAIRPSHRRVVHLDFAACELPGGLEWQWRV